MAPKRIICGVLKILGMHPFDCERCTVTDGCEGRDLRNRLQELSLESTETPDAHPVAPSDDHAA